jgi:hypothetical protein
MKKILWKIFKWPIYLSLGAIVLFLGSTDDPTWQRVGVACAITVIGVPMLLLVTAQLSFLVYNAIKHGNPFHEETEPYVYKVVHEKRQKAWCIICKKFTGCHVRKNPNTGMMIHVIR